MPPAHEELVAMAAKADSRLPASLTAYASCTHPLGHVQESLWGFATGQAHATFCVLLWISYWEKGSLARLSCAP